MTKQMVYRFFEWFEKIEQYAEETNTPFHQVVNIRQSWDQGSYERKLQVVEALQQFAEDLRVANELDGQSRYDQIQEAIKVIQELK